MSVLSCPTKMLKYISGLPIECLPTLQHLEAGELVHIAAGDNVAEGFDELLPLIVALVCVLYRMLRKALVEVQAAQQIHERSLRHKPLTPLEQEWPKRDGESGTR